MATNMILNLVLIPKYGIQGAAVATLLSQIIAAYISDLFSYKTKQMFYLKTKSFLLLNLIKRSLNVKCYF